MNIDQFMKKMNAKFGEGSLIELGGDQSNLDIETMPTGLSSLDLVLGNGGLARGRIIEIYGGEGAGKTALVSWIVAEAQRRAGQQPRTTKDRDAEDVKPISGRVAFIDVEHAYDPHFARQLGVQTDPGKGFYFSQPMSGEDALQEMQMIVESGLFDYVILDSVAGLLSESEATSDHGQRQIAQVATLMSTGLRKLTGAISKSRTIAIFINQIREKPAVMFGSPETTTGGRALKFHASYRLRISKKQQIKKGTQVVGHTMKISVKKNKLAPPFQDTEIDFYYQEVGEGKDYRNIGFDMMGDLIKTAKESGVLNLNGSQYVYADKETGEILLKENGAVKLISTLQENPEILEKIKEEVGRL